MTRVLGYPRLISVENFRQPNFPLLAEILKWLVKRFDPMTDIPVDTDTEQDRVLFIKSVAQFMATKAHIKLNTKKLYQADGYVVKELLKMTSVLYSALKLTPNENNDDSSNNNAANLAATFDISSHVSDLKRARELASEITMKGSSIHDLLSREVDLREIRTNTINRNLEIGEVEKGIKDAIRACQREGEKYASMLENIQSDEKNLDEKIQKKKDDLERNSKRLRTLKDVRPAYMDEYEALEKELEELYEQYLTKFRIQAYLEQQLDEYNRGEQEKFEESAKHMQSLIKKMREREREMNQLNDDDDIHVTSSDSENESKVKSNKKPSGNEAIAKRLKQKSENMGKMDADITDSSDNEKDLNDEDDDEDDDDEDDDDEDEDDDEISDSGDEQANIRQQQQQVAQRGIGRVSGSFSTDRTAAELAQRAAGNRVPKKQKDESDSDF